MGQVTIYLEEEIEKQMIAAAKSARLSKSKWIAKLIQDKVARDWPESVADIAGSWVDFPTIDDIRSDIGQDLDREPI